jgi:hypothetical protein
MCLPRPARSVPPEQSTRREQRLPACAENARRHVVAGIFIVDEAAMALAYDAARVTRDVGSLFMPHGIALD